MTGSTTLANRRLRNMAWVAGFAVLILIGLLVVYSQGRNRLTDPADVVPALTSEAGSFESYERAHGARDEAQVAIDGAAYEAYEQAHRGDKPPTLRKLPETPAR